MKTLNLEAMVKIEGGNVSQAEYCATLSMIMEHNPITAPMLNAWEAHCQS